MKVTKIKISSLNLSKDIFNAFFKRNRNNYFVDLIATKRDYFYRKDGITLEITKAEYENILINPYLYYFSSALRLQCRFNKAKELGLGIGWPNKPPAHIEEIFK